MDTPIEQIGKYKILGELGRGAMGIVYRGFDPLIEREVAIKTLRADLMSDGDQASVLERFKKEAQAAGRLNHPNIVQVYEYGVDGERVFIAMELISGKELNSYIAESARFDLRDIVRMMKELLSALGFAHANGVVHRDIKPSNIVVLTDGRIKVTDFGIARLESSTLTQAGNILGTPSYMSPEQFMAQRVDGRSDLYSAGVVLYELVTGEKPFAGNSFATIMHKALKETPVPATELNVTLPRSFDAVLTRAMAKRPDDRYQSAEEFTKALDAALEQTSAPDATLALNTGSPAVDNDATAVFSGADATAIFTPPSPTDDKTVVMSQSAGNIPQPEQSTPAAPTGKKTPVAWYALGAVLGIVGIGAGVMFSSGSKPAATEVPAGPSGVLNIETDPAGAVVLIDGGKFGGVTPAKLNLPVGIHQIVIQKDGHNSIESSVEVAPDAEIPFQASLSPAQ